MLLKPLKVTLLCTVLTLGVAGLMLCLPAKSNDAKLFSNSRLQTANLTYEPIKPILPNTNINYQIVALGRKLFYERSIGTNGKIACVDCHKLKQGGADKVAYSLNASGQPLSVNTPTIYNVSLNTSYYWTGRSHSLNQQVDDAIEELQTDWKTVLEKLYATPEYLILFSQSYPDGLNITNIKDAIVTFELSLLTPNSRFDKYLNGQANSISNAEKKGYELFKSYGCIACHQGTNVGGNILQEIDSMPYTPVIYFKNPSISKIRVPSLRNVSLTSPYLHDGSIKKLDAVVAQMGQISLGIDIPKHDIKLIVKFLGTLTGEITE